MTAETEYSEPALTRQMPHNLEAEAGVLGSLLLYPERVDLIRGLVEKEDFYSKPYGLILSAIFDMNDQNQPIDPLTLREELTRRDQLDIVGGAAGLSELTAAVPNSANLETYAKIVRDKSTFRSVISAGTEILEEGYKDEKSAEDMLDFSEHRIFQVGDRTGVNEASSLKDVLKNAWDELEKLHEREKAGITGGLSTQFHQLDQMLGGLHGGELIITAARPAMGKTTFTLNLLSNVGIEQKVPCLFFSLEMTKENIARNMLCAHSRVPSHSLRTGQLSNEQWGRLGLSTDTLASSPIFIDDSAMTLSEIRGKCRRLKRSHDIQLVAIDYLQLMQGQQRGREANRQQEISEISRGLKLLSKELSIPVIALSQLNRGVEGRADHKPMLSDLRESGAIEQDADVVMLLHRPDYYNPDDSPGLSHLIIAKQRNGPTGTVELVFIGDQSRFENLSPHADSEL